MRFRPLLATLALAGAVACSDERAPTAPETPTTETPSLKPAALSTLSFEWINEPVTQVGTGLTGVFNGTATVTSFATNAAGQLIATVEVVGQVTGGFTQTINETITQVVNNQLSRRCTILTLDLGPLFLDVLGLEIDLSEIELDITAVSGPGNLLGNLLCALVGILDQNPLAAQVGLLLAQINAILGALL
jgi:hypothetical protein